jgi:flagellar biosynthesis/type III secretory pathway chaperone
MAQKYTVELIAKTDKAINEIEDLKKEIKGLQSQVSEGNKNTANGLNTIGTAAKKTNRVLISVGNTLKAIGIGLLLASLEKLREVFASNQKVIDFFNITMETLTIAFNDLFNFLNANVGSVIGYFKSIFTDPLGAIRDMSAAIDKYLIRSFVNFLELIEVSGLAISKFFKGDWVGAIGLASVAGSKFVDVVTGVDDSLLKAGNAVNNIVEGIKGYVKGTINAATSTIELTKAAETAEIQLQGLLEKYDRQAEKLRQVRDEERNTIAERKKANEDLNTVLDEQEAAMLKLVDIQIASAQKQYDINGNQENYNNLLKITQEREAVLAQIEGFRSEQKSNDLALFREEIELNNSLRDADFERQIANEEFNASLIGNDVARIQRLRDIAQLESDLREEQLRDDLARTKLGTQAQVDAQNALFDFLQDNANKQKQLDADLADAKLATISGALGGIAQLVGENSKFGKGIAISQAIIDTYAGANKALAQGGIFGGIAAAGIIAGGLANVRNIVSTQEPQAPSFATGGGGSTAIAPIPSAPPAFNVVGTSGTNQLADLIAGQSKQPIKAYVVSSDVSTAQSLDRNIIEGASI